MMDEEASYKNAWTLINYIGGEEGRGEIGHATQNFVEIARVRILITVL